VIRLLMRGFRLEARTDAGRVNALLIALAFALMALIGGPDLLSRLIAIWSKDYSADFPVIPVLVILMGGGLICVLLLVLVEPVMSERRLQRRRRTRRR
jgi:hypothetical protein